jgi:isochorismate synthase
MDADGNGEWVVTIRCGVIKQNSIRLYAGAGIVQGSDPEAEFNETEAKLNTMLSALGLNTANDTAQATQAKAL